MDNKCEVVKDILPLYVDGVCSQESAQLVEEHVENCEECRKIQEQLSSTIKLPMEDGAEIKGFKKFIKKKVWIKVIIAVVAILIIGYIIKVAIALNVSEIWPKADEELFQELKVEEINGDLYLFHGGDLLGMGEIYALDDFEDRNDGVFKFYLGQPGYLPKFHHYFPLVWMSRDIYEKLPFVNYEGEYYLNNGSKVKKVIYCHKNGEEVVVVWEQD